MKKTTLSTFFEKRIEENKTLFTKGEITCMKENHKCIKKVYLLGLIDGKDCYKKSEN